MNSFDLSLEKHLGEDTLLRAENEEEEFTSRQLPEEFTKFSDRLLQASTLRELSHLRSNVLEWARRQKRHSEWELPVYGPALNTLLKQIVVAENQMHAENLEVLEAPEMTKILRDDPYQHDCDLGVCCGVMVGWSFVFFFCHLPWLITLALFSMKSNASLDDVHVMTPDLVFACQEISMFLFGFYIILAIIIFASLVVAIAQAVDKRQNCVVEYSARIMGVLSLTLVGYNIYGIIVVWVAVLWADDSVISLDCMNARNLTVACISFFFVLPILCYLVGLMGRTGKPSATPSPEIEEGDGVDDDDDA